MKFDFDTLKNTIKTEYNGYISTAKIFNTLLPFLTDEEMQDYLDGLCDNFNYLILKNGEGYVILKNIIAIRQFIKNTSISGDDDVWGEYVYLANGKQKKLMNI